MLTVGDVTVSMADPKNEKSDEDELYFVENMTNLAQTEQHPTPSTMEQVWQ